MTRVDAPTTERIGIAPRRTAVALDGTVVFDVGHEYVAEDDNFGPDVYRSPPAPQL